MPPPLVPSLLQAIVVMNGESMVLHTGERPYVVSERGQIPLAKSPLTNAAVDEIIDELIPPAARHAIEATGATQFVLPEHPLLPGERFSVVAAMAGSDAWLEIRRVTADDEDVQVTFAEAPVLDPPMLAPVVPLDRRRVHREPQVEPAQAQAPGPDHVLRLARARGASRVYLQTGARPAVRVDGAIERLDAMPVMDAGQVDALLRLLAPERSAEALRAPEAGEWTTEVDGIGRVRCVAFRDQAGPGGVIELLPARVATVEQLGVTADVLRLISAGDGLVVVAGPRSSGKRTLSAAFVDHLARTRRGHIITVEREIAVVQASARGVVSQREAPPGSDPCDVVRAALREDPDVLVLEDVRTPELLLLALDAAAPGRLVICTSTARSASAAIDRLLDLARPADRGRVQLALAHVLRGVVAQALVAKTGGGRVAARELLLNTPAVASLLAEGRTSQIPAMVASRDQGMVPMNDALAGLVTSGLVGAGEACAVATDRAGLLAQLGQRGIDVSSLEQHG